MRKLKRILLYAQQGIDPAPAIGTAFRLASENDAHLTILDVVADVGVRLAVLGKVANRRKIQAALIAQRKEELESIFDPSELKQVKAAIRVVAGSAFIEVVRDVLKYQQQMLIKPVAAETERSRLFGGNDMHLLRKCPCPVWMVKSGKRSPIRVVLAAVDPAGAENRRLSEKLLDFAAGVAIREGATLHVVHAWNFPYEHALRSRNVMSEKAVAEMRMQIQSGHEDGVKKLLVRRALRDVTPTVHVLEGRPSRLILGVAERQAADLIVMGTVGRTGVAGMLIGNTAERVLNEVRCSVLAIKPDGFETPVR